MTVLGKIEPTFFLWKSCDEAYNILDLKMFKLRTHLELEDFSVINWNYIEYSLPNIYLAVFNYLSKRVLKLTLISV